jgi:hypothetical protein
MAVMGGYVITSKLAQVFSFLVETLSSVYTKSLVTVYGTQSTQ